MLEKIVEIFNDLMEEEQDITLETKKRDIEEWDSLFTVNLIITLNMEFDIKISLEEAAQLDSIQSILALLEKKREQ